MRRRTRAASAPSQQPNGGYGSSTDLRAQAPRFPTSPWGTHLVVVRAPAVEEARSAERTHTSPRRRPASARTMHPETRRSAHTGSMIGSSTGRRCRRPWQRPPLRRAADGSSNAEVAPQMSSNDENVTRCFVRLSLACGSPLCLAKPSSPSGRARGRWSVARGAVVRARGGV